MSLDEQIKALADAYNRVNGPGSGFAFGDGAAKARELLVKTSDEHRLRRIWIGDACDEWALSPVDGWDEYCPVTELIAEHARADRLEAQVKEMRKALCTIALLDDRTNITAAIVLAKKLARETFREGEK